MTYNEKTNELNVPDITMYEMVRRISRKHPDAAAYEYLGTTGTYRELFEGIDSFAKSFAACGVRAGDTVTVCMPNTPEAVFAIYALNKIGAAANVIHPLSAQAEIRNYITSAGSRVAVAVDMCVEKIKGIAGETGLEKIVVVSPADSMPALLKTAYRIKTKKVNLPADGRFIGLREFLRLGEEARIPVTQAEPSLPAVILHSGGTTGTPKEIVLTNKGFNSLGTQALIVLKDVTVNDRVLAILPVFHAFGLGVCVHVTFCLGACSVLIPRFEAAKFTKLMKKHKPSMVFGVPTLYEALINAPHSEKLDLSNLKYLVSGGDSLSETLEKRLNNYLKLTGAPVKVIQGYGLTESLGAVCLASGDGYKPGSIGKPLPGNRFCIVKPGTCELLPANTDGEICVSGPTLMSGYRNNEKETSEVLKKHEDGRVWLHTGDIGSIDEDGCIFYRLRLKRLIITSGYNVYPSHIEKIIEQHKAVAKCVVIGVPHPYKVEVAKAYIVLKADYSESDELRYSIREHCRKNLARYSVPAEFEFRKTMPKTPLGKIDFNALKAEHMAKYANGENKTNGKNIKEIGKQKEEERSGNAGVQDAGTCA
ncbi:MAG: acyl--CoA ligase [Clostridia bacterium]|nr:acyl--CoA ligase [Clostridia bacterium]